MTLQVLKQALRKAETTREAWEVFWVWAKRRKQARIATNKTPVYDGINAFDPAWRVLMQEIHRAGTLERLQGGGT